MVNEKAPERIFATGFGLTKNHDWAGAQSTLDGSVEYIRADLCYGDPKEPLKDGQYRWVRHKSTPAWPDIARVSIDYDGVWMHETGGDAYGPDQYVYIGPVIRPPEDK